MTEQTPLYRAVVEGDAAAAKSLTETAIAENVDPLRLVGESLIPAMDEVGRLFEEEEYFIPEMLLSARAMKASMELIRPRLAESGAQPTGRVVIGTVKGDLHDIGKNLVSSMLEGAGFEVIDLGVDVDPAAFVQAVQERGAQLVCLSTLLTTTMPSMQRTIEALREAGLRENVKILVGGAPITPEYAQRIGADGYGGNARAAVTEARRFIAA